MTDLPIDDPRTLRALRWAATFLLATGLVSCVARGADRPADPVLGEPVTAPTPPPAATASTSSTSAPPPG